MRGALALAAGLVSLAFLASGCGGGSKSPSVANLGTSTSNKLPKPAFGVAIGDFYARQLDGWLRKPIGSCEWSFTSPKGALVYVDACRGSDPMTAVYVVDVNHDQARVLKN